MPTLFVNSSVIADGLIYNITPYATNLYLAKDTTLASNDLDTIYASDNSHTVTVAGQILAAGAGIYLTSVDSYAQTVIVRSTGSVEALDTGVFLEGNFSKVDNAGLISGSVGVYLSGIGVRVMNHGTIDTTNGAISVASGGMTDTRGTVTVNYGTISSQTQAYLGDFTGDDVLRNFGTITGNISTGDGMDIVENHGHIAGNIEVGALGTVINSGGEIFGNITADFMDNTLRNSNGLIEGNITLRDGADVLLNLRGGIISGDVDLGVGNDRYDGYRGIVESTVYAGAGNDVLMGNPDEADSFDGGFGTDLLVFRRGPAVTVALDQSFENAGAAAGDTYVSFESVWGSAAGADHIRGTSSTNTLFGFGGNDWLDGAGGGDVLRGGEGLDTLTGGAGNDTFRYATVAEMGDLILDFTNSPIEDDRFQFRAATFPGFTSGTTLDALAFQASDDNIAQTADTRFVYRTTDSTLWYDADGSGGREAVIVATLQLGAVVTNLDITFY